MRYTIDNIQDLDNPFGIEMTDSKPDLQAVAATIRHYRSFLVAFEALPPAKREAFWKVVGADPVAATVVVGKTNDLLGRTIEECAVILLNENNNIPQSFRNLAISAILRGYCKRKSQPQSEVIRSFARELPKSHLLVSCGDGFFKVKVSSE